MTPEEEILAANATYVPNRTTPFTVTPEGQKYGVIDINGTVGHIQQDKRTPEQQNALFQLYQSIAPAKIDVNDPIAVRNYNTQVYNQLHKEGKVDDFYRSKGLITPNAPTQAAPAQATPEALVQKAAETGKSYLQLYQESMPKPEYEQERADRIQTNSKASIIADILKLVGEGVTTKKGGTPIVRQSAVPMLNAELQKLNDLYKNEVRAYKQGAFNALLMDEQEKKRAASVEAARKAALQQTLLTQAAQAERETARQKSTSEEKEKDRKFTATQNELNRRNTLVAAQKRAENGGGKGDRDKNVFLSVNGKSVPMPESIVNEISANYKEKVIPGTKGSTMTPKEIAQKEWSKYYDYVNGEFVPKGTGSSRKTIPGISGQTTTTTQNNSSKKKIVGF